MSRIGFKSDAESIEATVQGIVMINSLLKNIRIDGIFTHFACADCEDDHMTFKQLKRFDNVIDRLEKNDVHIPIKHCANSAAIIKYPGMRMNMARAGIIIYGLYPSDEVDREVIKLEPVMRLKSHVIYVKTVEPGHHRRIWSYLCLSASNQNCYCFHWIRRWLSKSIIQ